MDSSPSLRLERVHIRGLRGIERLDLPKEGMGWAGRFPPVAMLGGANGSGKTTLLRCIAGAAQAFVDSSGSLVMPRDLDARECRLDFTLREAGGHALSFAFLVGDDAFLNRNREANSVGYRRFGLRAERFATGLTTELAKYLSDPAHLGRVAYPRVVLLPSDERELFVPEVESYKFGPLSDDAGFVVVWNRDAARAWRGSTVELLYKARWADFNAKENNRSDAAVNFQYFTQAFSDFSGGNKRLGWTDQGDLVVLLADGTHHSLKDLSAGERQAVLLLAELRRSWRRGSLILIDEPELHLHDAWQGRLYESILGMQRELGGQVILTTQSHSLFAMAEQGTRALLGRSPLR